MHGWEDRRDAIEEDYLKTLYALHRFNCTRIKEKSRKIDWNAWDPFLFGVVSGNSSSSLIISFPPQLIIVLVSLVVAAAVVVYL